MSLSRPGNRHAVRGLLALAVASSLALLAACRSAPAKHSEPLASGATADPCAGDSAVLGASAFVLVTSPTAGATVTSGFAVTGCSRTFESTVQWRLLARNGSELASGHTQGGGVDGAGPFRFTVDFQVDAPQLGHLEVFEEDASSGEGFPPGRTVLPLVLER